MVLNVSMCSNILINSNAYFLKYLKGSKRSSFFAVTVAKVYIGTIVKKKLAILYKLENVKKKKSMSAGEEETSYWFGSG